MKTFTDYIKESKVNESKDSKYWDMLGELDDYARSVDKREFGLPDGKEHNEKMTAIVKNILNNG